MPADFERCMRTRGRKVRTIKPTEDTYQHICILGDKSYGGEVHHRKSPAAAVQEAGRK